MPYNQSRKKGIPTTFLLVPAMAVAAALGYGASDRVSSLPLGALTRSDCNIKGNLSSSGELIYHVPGQRYYDDTRISPGKGERWFCSEPDARAAGWRKSKV